MILLEDFMAQHLIQKNYNFIQKLPEWAKTFAIKYCSNTASTYIFHGNIRTDGISTDIPFSRHIFSTLCCYLSCNVRNILHE